MGSLGLGLTVFEFNGCICACVAISYPRESNGCNCQLPQNHPTNVLSQVYTTVPFLEELRAASSEGNLCGG